MTVLISLIVGTALPLLIVWAALRFFPSTVTKFVEKEIERRSDAKLERLRAELQGSYSTLKSSVDVLLATNSGIQPHIIAAVTALWSNIVEIRNYSSNAVTFETMFFPAEAEGFFANQSDAENQKALAFVERYRDELSTLQNPAFKADLDHHRLFCGDRLWAKFFAIRATLGRLTALMCLSLKKGVYQDWRKDEPIGRLVRVVVPGDLLEGARSEIGGLSQLLYRMEAEFLHEATKVMSGSDVLADKLADLHSVMLLRNAVVASQGQ